jgi:hypothetical protein
MQQTGDGYPLSYSVDYPDRPLSRPSTWSSTIRTRRG